MEWKRSNFGTYSCKVGLFHITLERSQLSGKWVGEIYNLTTFDEQWESIEEAKEGVERLARDIFKESYNLLEDSRVEREMKSLGVPPAKHS